MFQDVPSFIFSYQPIIHSSKKNFQQNPFLISPFQNFKSSADTFLFLFYFLIYILGKSTKNLDLSSLKRFILTSSIKHIHCFRLDPLSKISGTDIYSHSTFSPRSRFVSVLSKERNELINEYDSQEGDPLRGNKIRGQIVASKTCTKFSRISQSVSRIGQRCVYITTVNRDELQPRD